MSDQISETGDRVIVTLDGDIDLEHSPTVRATLLGSLDRGLPVLVDLSAVTYIDSSGIANLIEAFQAAQARDMAFGLVGAAGQVMRVLELARLDKVFELHDSVAAALAEG